MLKGKQRAGHLDVTITQRCVYLHFLNNNEPLVFLIERVMLGLHETLGSLDR